MVATGPETQQEIRRGLNLRPNFPVKLYYKDVLALHDNPSVDLRFASNIFVQQDIHISPNIDLELKDSFRTGVEFFTKTNGAKRINR